jgi:hypothetical protein
VDELIAIDLTDDERGVLRAGLVEWGGPARVTQDLARAMGFLDQADLFRQCDRIITELEADRPLLAFDWARTVLATEIVFASDLVGSGVEWSITTGLSDEDTVRTLRGLQRKLPGPVRAVIGSELGTRPPGQPGR